MASGRGVAQPVTGALSLREGAAVGARFEEFAKSLAECQGRSVRSRRERPRGSSRIERIQASEPIGELPP